MARERAPIRRLDASTVARIAAGEVVESPASVVKELVENAYDAGATEIRIEIQEGGIQRIRVSDDGEGIPPSELPLAVERHATSKLAGSEPLDQIRTLGFRGEALASIGAVARLSIRSRPRSSDAAHGLRVEDGRIVEEFVEGAPPGTAVEVRDLFFQTPARRKFLRSASAEQVEVARVVGALHLARPTVGIALASEGVELVRYPKGATLADALVRVLGEELLGELLEIGPSPLGDDGPSVRAVLGRPTISRGSFSSLYLSVNGRVVASRALQSAVRAAYDDYLPRGRFPVGAVHLEIDLARVDVNVHPTKREVRIQREREVAESLRRRVRAALRGEVAVADIGPRALRPFSAPLGPASPRPPEPVRIELSGLTSPAAEASPAVQARLDMSAPPRHVPGRNGRPSMVLVGNLFRLYWVGESADALVLVDQHAASERVVFEALRADGRLARQELVAPVILTLSARQAASWAANRDAIDAAGFSVEPFGGSAFRVASVPVSRGRLARAESLPELLDELADGGRPAGEMGWADRRAASIACHAAVRGGDAIDSEQMGRILEALYRLPESNYACPHGRPILLRIDRRRLDQWFLRSSP
ncbi:MAG TPA: DNA mismatch repair endonuclease MutL [Thermoplasmata archaeon]|nr:DNA mismatch repair endonuclease MutL [Thermoplasmata archaeon]